MSLNLVSNHPTDLAGQSQQQLLRFRLESDLTAAIEIVGVTAQGENRVTELVNIPLDRVVPMPHLPPTILGVYNWRGEILWIVNFVTLLGLNPAPGISSPQHYRSLQPTIVLTNVTSSGNSMAIGLVVDRIDEIEWCQPNLARSASPHSLETELAPWTKGYWRSATGEQILVFEGQTIFDRAELHADI
jgi:positive phototaxis protein PixI